MYPGSTGFARFHDHPCTRLQWSQRFKKNLQLSEKTILLARNTKTNLQTLQEMQGVHATKPRTAREVFRSF